MRLGNMRNGFNLLKYICLLDEKKKKKFGKQHLWKKVRHVNIEHA